MGSGWPQALRGAGRYGAGQGSDDVLGLPSYLGFLVETGQVPLQHQLDAAIGVPLQSSPGTAQENPSLQAGPQPPSSQSAFHSTLHPLVTWAPPVLPSPRSVGSFSPSHRDPGFPSNQSAGTHRALLAQAWQGASASRKASESSYPYPAPLCGLLSLQLSLQPLWPAGTA